MKAFLNRVNLSLIIVSYSALVLALYAQLNLYVVLLGAACAAWRILNFYGKIALMGRLLLSVVAITSSVVTLALLYPQGIFNLMLHLIFLGFSLKFLELRSRRDIYFFVNTGFVLIALFFIFNTSIGATLIASLLVMLLLTILLSLHADHLNKNHFIKLLFKGCLLSLPLAVLLFVVMPRLPSLWKMPNQKQATTGLSDTVSPGEIAKLSRSSALAFRVTFEGAPVPEQQRYWRAMTLDQFDGKTWSQSAAKKRQEQEAKRGEGLRFYPVNSQSNNPQNNNIQNKKSKYELIIEPHYNYWLPVLDYAITPTNLLSLTDYSLRSDKPIVTRQAFTVQKMDSIQSPMLTKSERKQLTQLPESKNNKTANIQTDTWILENLQNGMSKENILNQLLVGFSQSFRYTLQPPLLGEKQIDDFLFNSKAGFCVHYASSYLYVARRLGFPSRMVTGYLGGEWQDSERFMTVRQYDAHAWVEIWQDGRWHRIDPTASVSPERVESGLQAGLTDANEFLADEYFSLQKWRGIALLDLFRSRFAQLDYLWARWVVNFDNKKQLQLMQRWLTHVPWMSIAYAVMFVMAFIFITLLMLIFKPWQTKHICLEDKIYLQLQHNFSKKGITRTSGQTVSEYCLLLAVDNPEKSALCEHFVFLYNRLKYDQNLSRKQYTKKINQLRVISKKIKKS